MQLSRTETMADAKPATLRRRFFWDRNAIKPLQTKVKAKLWVLTINGKQIILVTGNGSERVANVAHTCQSGKAITQIRKYTLHVLFKPDLKS